jgi:hypothetical protein
MLKCEIGFERTERGGARVGVSPVHDQTEGFEGNRKLYGLHDLSDLTCTSRYEVELPDESQCGFFLAAAVAGPVLALLVDLKRKGRGEVAELKHIFTPLDFYVAVRHEKHVRRPVSDFIFFDLEKRMAIVPWKVVGGRCEGTVRRLTGVSRTQIQNDCVRMQQRGAEEIYWHTLRLLVEGSTEKFA